jgi:hypothetical protein
MSPARLGGLLALAMAAVGLGAPAADAAGPPQVSASWASNVTATSARLHAEVNPNGLATSARAEYVSVATYQANLAAQPPRDGFSGAIVSPGGPGVSVGDGTTDQELSRQVNGLKPNTAYRYRFVAINSEATTVGPLRTLTSTENAPVFTLPDSRGWELVSPVDKNGGAVEGVGAIYGGGVLQAAVGGDSATYGSRASFGVAQGAPGASQYISRRTSTGWSTENITPAGFSGGYGDAPDGVPYQLFSSGLSAGLLASGSHCRGAAGDCPQANPPLAGSGAPAGYLTYYLRESAGGGFQSLLTEADVAGLSLPPQKFDIAFAGATPDLAHVLLSSCAALTPEATEVPGPEGTCDADSPNLYRWSGESLALVNLLPGDPQGTPGASLAAPAGAISADAARVYFAAQGNLYLRSGGQTVQVDAGVGGGGSFQAASMSGSLAFFLEEGHLHRYDAVAGTSADLTPAGGVEGVLGASADGTHVYYLTAAGLFLNRGGTTTEVAAGADPGNYPPSTGTARVSADGRHLAFLASAPLSDYDNNGVAQAYVYAAATDTLTCVSCNPTGERPSGPASIPGAAANGKGPLAMRAYKPRALSAAGTRLFFDTSDGLVPQDTNNDGDVYQWEAQGVGSCQRPAGCLDLISSGRGTDGASFVDASADGSDAFFLTDDSLVAADPGSVDLYDARVGGGFPAPSPPTPCLGDACQIVPGEPEDPVPGTAFLRPEGNPPVSYPKAQGKKKHRKKKSQRKKHKRGAQKQAAAKKGGRR